MPSYTFPNQRVINIHREQVKSDFLGIKNENWMAASRALGAHALRLYLYLAANKNGYSLALSPAAIQEAIGMPTSTYRDQFRKLESLGYIVFGSGNTYDFYEVPRPVVVHNDVEVKREPSGLCFDDTPTAVHTFDHPVQPVTGEDIEINNKRAQINSILNNYGAASSPGSAKRKACDIWPSLWDGFVTDPNTLLTEEEARAMYQEMIDSFMKPSPPVKAGEFNF